MNFKEYSKDVQRTWKPGQDFDEALGHASLKLAGEAGELANAVGKYLYQGHELPREEVIEELGDQFFYMAVIMELYDVSLDEVMEYNVQKRDERYPAGFDVDRSINRG